MILWPRRNYKGIIRNCPVFIQKVKTTHRLEPCKAITVNGPGQRLEFILTYLNDDLAMFSMSNIYWELLMFLA